MNNQKYLLLGAMSIAVFSVFAASTMTLQLAHAQNVPAARIDTSPNAAVIIINSDASGNIHFVPNKVTIKVGEEILILNNSTSPQSFTNGKGKDDPLSGKMFDTGLIQPKQFVEYVASNVAKGEYPFYSTAAPSATGTLTVH